MSFGRTFRVAAVCAAILSGAGGAVAQEIACDTSVASALDKQRMAYIAAQSDLADRNYSRRPGSFATTTCLDNLMQGGGLDIFFKPPSLDNILGMVKNLACQQASQIFNGLMGGVGGGAGLQVGELLPGVNLGGTLVQFQMGSGGSYYGSGGSYYSSIPDASLRSLFR